MADPPGALPNNTSLQTALDEHLARLQQQQQQTSTTSMATPPAVTTTSGDLNQALLTLLARQQQPQQQQQPTPAVATSSDVEHGLLRALQQQGAAAGPRPPPSSGESVATQTPAASATATLNLIAAATAPAAQQQQATVTDAIAALLRPPPPPPPHPNTSLSLGNALSTVLQASNTADMALTARNCLDEIAILRALGLAQTQVPPPPPPPPPAPAPPAADALAQLLTNPTALSSALETILTGNVTSSVAASTTASAPPVPAQATSSAAAAAKPKAEEDQPVPEQEEYYPLPDLPKVRPLPPLEEGETPHFDQRTCVPLAIEEDSNWLSERQCFIRAELLEVVRASHQDVLVRSSSKSVAYQQVGIRCRYCAHLHPSARAIRSSAFPSSIRQMYQSFTMMVRDHWAGCTAMPPHLKKRFLNYQEHKIPSSSLSREYWAYAAKKIGMINTQHGITITEESLAKAETLHSFGTTPEHIQAMQAQERTSEALVHPSDKAAISPYLYELMSLVEVCYLLESERVGKRKDAPIGLTGFGCKHCIHAGRLGFCRVFPLNKRSLPTKVNDLFNHFQRCPLTPADTRKALRKLKQENSTTKRVSAANAVAKFTDRDREFVDQIWAKLGRKGAQV